MNIEELREYCLSLKKVTESFPFDKDTLVFKVAGKMFCLTNLAGDLSVNLKNEPEKNLELRENCNAVKPGYHMNKKHWNTVEINGSIPDKLIKDWINESYNLVVQKLPGKIQNELKNE
ncbi:MAG: MmcQ/YjbR family DNA-binding protein [Prolixibacteraceae bacterium]